MTQISTPNPNRIDPTHTMNHAATPSLQDISVSLQKIVQSQIDVQESQNEFAAVFEVAWEVANKVGSIYTTIRSKASEAVSQLGEDYFLMVKL